MPHVLISFVQTSLLHCTRQDVPPAALPMKEDHESAPGKAVRKAWIRPAFFCDWRSLPKFPQFVFLFPQLGWPDLSAIYEQDVSDRERVGRQEGRGHAGAVRLGCQGRKVEPRALFGEHLDHHPLLAASLITLLSLPLCELGLPSWHFCMEIACLLVRLAN